jgi:hypothetical protein
MATSQGRARPRGNAENPAIAALVLEPPRTLAGAAIAGIASRRRPGGNDRASIFSASARSTANAEQSDRAEGAEKIDLLNSADYPGR